MTVQQEDQTDANKKPATDIGNGIGSKIQQLFESDQWRLISHARYDDGCIRVEIMAIIIFPFPEINHGNDSKDSKKAGMTIFNNFLFPQIGCDQEQQRKECNNIGKNFKLKKVFRMKGLHADIMIQPVDDVDISTQFVRINKQYQSFRILGCSQLYLPEWNK